LPQLSLVLSHKLNLALVAVVVALVVVALVVAVVVVALVVAVAVMALAHVQNLVLAAVAAIALATITNHVHRILVQHLPVTHVQATVLQIHVLHALRIHVQVVATVLATRVRLLAPVLLNPKLVVNVETSAVVKHVSP
jgi:hypothetical protein